MAEENNNNVGEIAGSIKSGLAPTRGMTRTSTATVASMSSSFSNKIGENKESFDALISSNSQFAGSVETFANTLKKVSELNRKEFDQQRTVLVKAIEEMKEAAGDDNKELVEKVTAGLQDQAMGMQNNQREGFFGKVLDYGQNAKENIGARIKEANNVDQDAGFFKGIGQAFSPDRMFPDLFGKGFKKDQAISGVKVKGKIGFGGGVDQETPAEKQTEILEKILDVLEGIAADGGMGGGGGLSAGGFPRRNRGPRPGRNTKPNNTKPNNTKPNKTNAAQDRKNNRTPQEQQARDEKARQIKEQRANRGKAPDVKKGGKGLLKGLARGAKFLPGVGLAVSAGMGAYDAFQGVQNAGETFGLEEGQEASLGQKFAAGAGGLLSGLSFGLADGDKMAKGLYGFFGGDDDSPEEMQKRGMEIPSDTDGAQLSEKGQAAVDALKGDGVPEVNPETGKRGMVIGDTPTAKPSVAEEGAAMLANKPGEGKTQAQQMLEKLKAGTTNVTPTTTGKAAPAKRKGTASDIDMDAYGKALDKIEEKQAELEAIGDLSGVGQREMNSPEFKEKRERQKALKAEIAQLFKEADAAMGNSPEKDAAFDAALEGDGSFDAALEGDGSFDAALEGSDDFYDEGPPTKGTVKKTTTKTETGGGSITRRAAKRVDNEKSTALRGQAEEVQGKIEALEKQLEAEGKDPFDSEELSNLYAEKKNLNNQANQAMTEVAQDDIIEAGKNQSSTIVESATADASQSQAPTIINNNQSAPPAAPASSPPVIVTSPIGVRNNESSAKENVSRVY